MKTRVTLVLALLLLAAAGLSFGTSIKSVTLAALFSESDVVALVRVTAADSLAFKNAVYRAQVIQPFKGVSVGSQIYFGPYESYALGKEYLVFLRRTRSTLGAMVKTQSNPWAATEGELYLEILYGGYSILDVEYSCAIEPCDYAISVPSSQVIMPDDLPRYPQPHDPGSRYDTWVRRDALIRRLEGLAGTDK
jgi:hypothetical protein